MMPRATPQHPPIGLDRNGAASHIGVGTTTFDEMVADGRMPPPRHVTKKGKRWHRLEVEQAFEDLPQESPSNENPWDDVL